MTTIIKSQHSRNIENLDWQMKMAELRNSSTRMSAALTAIPREKWDEDNIAERNQEMTELFIRTYPRANNASTV